MSSSATPAIATANKHIHIVSQEHDTPLGIRQLSKQLFFRQSMINQYISCPQEAMYDAILHFDESTPFFAAIAGTAGHEVMFKAHAKRNFNLSYMQIMEMFTEAFQDTIASVEHLPNIGVNFSSLDEQLASITPSYTQMIHGYLSHKKTESFHSTLHEQLFALSLNAEHLSPYPFIFTGTIDQAGYTSDGNFVLRDIKFRDDAFRPEFTQFSLDIQMTVYAYALRYGVPACEKCRPYYNEADNYKCVYHGPCDKCAAKIGTAQWPQKYPEVCELVWMRDFLRYSKDQFSEYIKDPDKVKVRNPKTGKPIIREIRNPKYAKGYKTGEFKGEGFIPTTRPPTKLEVLMADVLRVANSIRNGIYYRKPSERCNRWCRFREHCVNQIELDMETSDVSQLGSAFATHDPFAD